MIINSLSKILENNKSKDIDHLHKFLNISLGNTSFL